MNTPPLWKATILASKADAADLAALLELTPPHPQAVLVSEEPFRDDATVEALYSQMPDGDLLEKLAGRAVHVALLDQAEPGRLAARPRGTVLRVWRA
jgi:ribosomal protein L11 methyltransferase